MRKKLSKFLHSSPLFTSLNNPRKKEQKFYLKIIGIMKIKS